MKLGLISVPDILARDILAWIFHLHGHFGTLTIGPQGHSRKWKFHHCGSFGMGAFWHVDFSGQGHGDILARGLFGMRTFQDKDMGVF